MRFHKSFTVLAMVLAAFAQAVPLTADLSVSSSNVTRLETRNPAIIAEMLLAPLVTDGWNALKDLLFGSQETLSLEDIGNAMGMQLSAFFSDRDLGDAKAQMNSANAFTVQAVFEDWHPVPLSSDETTFFANINFDILELRKLAVAVQTVANRIDVLGYQIAIMWQSLANLHIAILREEYRLALLRDAQKALTGNSVDSATSVLNSIRDTAMQNIPTYKSLLRGFVVHSLYLYRRKGYGTWNQYGYDSNGVVCSIYARGWYLEHRKNTIISYGPSVWEPSRRCPSKDRHCNSISSQEDAACKRSITLELEAEEDRREWAWRDQYRDTFLSTSFNDNLEKTIELAQSSTTLKEIQNSINTERKQLENSCDHNEGC
ncbi:hypothetical protein BJ875DRAFT_446515 [Amylocarpus encephaloides]|uniref:Uncharacterized protein n=1 Tax=Amylocarpus encephaloides TaxID=45428 RepID=A0A9P8BZU2_9HELO|nr:hypothetical protein BJ875DRAFT_446515 [Amylocarpus encephaloides]